jgi:serine/threonine protein kinase
MTTEEQSAYQATERMPGGGTSNIYRIKINGRDYAIKVSPFNLQKEVDIYEAIGNHPNILKIVQSGVLSIDTSEIEGDNNTGTFHAIVFPFIESNLATQIKENNLSLQEKVMISKQVLDALDHIHSKGITKNDIKSDDVLIGSAEDVVHAYLADFNTVKHFNLADELEQFQLSQQVDFRHTLDMMIEIFSQSNELVIKEALSLLRDGENISIKEIRNIFEKMS